MQQRDANGRVFTRDEQRERHAQYDDWKKSRDPGIVITLTRFNGRLAPTNVSDLL